MNRYTSKNWLSAPQFVEMLYRVILELEYNNTTTWRKPSIGENLSHADVIG